MNKKLRQMNNADLELVRAWRNHDSINKYMFRQEYVSADQHQEWFKKLSNDPLHNLLIFEEDNKPCGFMQIKQKDELAFVFEWGFYVDPESNKGTGTRMLKLVIDKLFSEYGAHKIYGEVLAFNDISIHLHQRLGFHQEGHLKEHVVVNNQYHDVLCFGLLKEY